VISGITLSGRLLLQIQDHAFRTPDVVQFLVICFVTCPVRCW
jgi:hypothetical protein